MKFLCSNCKAKYQIADEKVAGRTLRMTCRRCQEEIVIRGEPQAPSAATPIGRLAAATAAPSPLGADFQMQVGSTMRASSVPMTALEEWHVAVNDVPVGPIRREDIARKLAAGAIDLDSLAWREGMDDWQPIREIPELGRLSATPNGLPLTAPPPLHAPQSRLGAHAPSAPYPVDPWAMPQERPSQVMVNPMLDGGASQQRSLPSWPAMFALAGGFAFLMSGLAIFGANWLKDSPQAAGPTAGAAGAAAVAPEPVKPKLELPDEDALGELDERDAPEPMVIGVDELPGKPRASSRPRSTTGASQNKPARKNLSEEQKAMLARMGGDTGTNLSNLGGDSLSGTSRSRATGSLTGGQVSKVVLRGKKNLQRCYETALRGSGSEETVRIDVELTVAPSGNVSSVKSRGGGPSGMATCIERTIKMWRFPESGESSPVRFPLVFQPGA